MRLATYLSSLAVLWLPTCVSQNLNIDHSSQVSLIQRNYFPGRCVALVDMLLRYDQTAGSNLYVCNSSGTGWNVYSPSVSPGATVTAGASGVTGNYVVTKDVSSPTNYILPSVPGTCGYGFATSTASPGSTFTLESTPGQIYTAVADNNITAGDILVGYAATPGRVSDSGYTSAASIPSTTCIVGTATTSASAGSSVSVLYAGQGAYGTSVTLGGALGGTAAASYLTGGYTTFQAGGDSLTTGAEDGTGVTYPSVMSSILNVPVINNAIGGQTSTQIAVRLGCQSPTVTIAGGTIPASGSVTVTFPSGYEPGNSLGPVNGVSGIISGVFGTLTLLSGSTFTFSRQSPGAAVSVSSAPFTASNQLKSQINLLWLGRNNLSSTIQVESDIAGCVAASTANQYAVLSILNAEGEGTGTANYNSIIAINTNSSSLYGVNYKDVRTYIVGQYNPANPVDVIDHTNDIPPYSLRAKYNATLNSALSTTVACPVSAYSLGANQIVLIGTEYIYMLSSSTCTRGYAGTTATTYTNGTAFTVADNLHLNSSGYTLVGEYLANGYANNSAQSIGSLLNTWSSPGPIGAQLPSTGKFTGVSVVPVLGATGLTYNGFGISVDGGGIAIGASDNTGQGLLFPSQSDSASNNQFQFYHGSGGQFRFIQGGSFALQLSASLAKFFGTVQGTSFQTSTNCSSTTSPAVCASAAAGKVQVAASGTTLTINTTAVTANSEISLIYSTVGITAPSNIASLITPYVSAITAGTSFTITLPVAPTGFPVNVTYLITN